MNRSVSWSICLVAGIALTGLAAVATPAAAASCKTWSASMTEDEGGPAMTAIVCTDDTQGAPALVLQCGAPLDLRYDIGEKAGSSLEPGLSASFVFTAGTASITRKLDLEAMDNMFTTELKPADPLLALLQSGHAVSVADTGGKYGSNSFSLSGSRAAIAKVQGSCKASAAAGGDDDD